MRCHRAGRGAWAETWWTAPRDAPSAPTPRPVSAVRRDMELHWIAWSWKNSFVDRGQPTTHDRTAWTPLPISVQEGVTSMETLDRIDLSQRTSKLRSARFISRRSGRGWIEGRAGVCARLDVTQSRFLVSTMQTVPRYHSQENAGVPAIAASTPHGGMRRSPRRFRAGTRRMTASSC